MIIKPKSIPTSFLSFIFFTLFLGQLVAQPISRDSIKIDYINPAEYTIGGLAIDGLTNYDAKIIIALTGFFVGDKMEVPSEKFGQGIKRMWDLGFFKNITVTADSAKNGKLYLRFTVEEVPILSTFRYNGIKREERQKLDDRLKGYLGKRATPQLKLEVTNTLKDYYSAKGYYTVSINIDELPNPDLPGKEIYAIAIASKNKVKINRITITGNAFISDRQLRRAMKETKERHWYNLKASKFEEEAYSKDKKRVLTLYGERGMRDAEILHDTVYLFNSKRLNIDITIEEGHKYYLRNIKWAGNTKYSTDTLNLVLGLKKGDVYSQTALDRALYMNPLGTDVSSLYLDKGYLFFNITPVETAVSGDSVDIELRITEGIRATINRVTITGNLRTKDHVIMREIYTKPGQLFSRTELLLSQQALMRLGYFEPDKVQAIPKPDAAAGTVDIEYIVVEKKTDQVFVSGGIGAGRVVGTANLIFNNFSVQDMLKPKAWRPTPAGNGQILALTAQSNGKPFQSYTLSVTEPWLGGRKPNSLTGAILYNAQNPNSESRFNTFGLSLGLGTKWKKPDTYFNSYYNLNFFKYFAQNFPGIPFQGNGYNLNLGANITRNSIDPRDYPEYGSSMSLSVQATPPWSLLSKNINKELIEYHKWKFDFSYFQKLAGKLVLNATAHIGYVGYYNKALGPSPFEQFKVGGVQLSGSSYIGIDYINQRGYAAGSLSPTNSTSALYNRFVIEMRYPLLVNSQANTTIYGLAFAEAGNAWGSLKDYNPANLKRSVGAGIRLVIPILGMLGVDYGYGFDRPDVPYTGTHGQWHIILGKYFN